MHNREYTVLLRPYEGGMMLHTMYYEEEVEELESFGELDVELKDAEVKVAHQLIEALAGKFEPREVSRHLRGERKEADQGQLEGREVTEVEKPARWRLSWT